MVCYLICKEGGIKVPMFMYVSPCFANIRKGGSSDKVHKAIKSFTGNVPGATS